MSLQKFYEDNKAKIKRFEAIVLDTFKNPLSVFFPNLELILYNLFETLRDLILFAKDLR